MLERLPKINKGVVASALLATGVVAGVDLANAFWQYTQGFADREQLAYSSNELKEARTHITEILGAPTIEQDGRQLLITLPNNVTAQSLSREVAIVSQEDGKKAYERDQLNGFLPRYAELFLACFGTIVGAGLLSEEAEKWNKRRQHQTAPSAKPATA